MSAFLPVYAHFLLVNAEDRLCSHLANRTQTPRRTNARNDMAHAFVLAKRRMEFYAERLAVEGAFVNLPKLVSSSVMAPKTVQMWAVNVSRVANQPKRWQVRVVSVKTKDASVENADHRTQPARIKAVYVRRNARSRSRYDAFHLFAGQALSYPMFINLWSASYWLRTS